jgi:hypothetical protein
VPRRTAPVKPDPAEPVIAGGKCDLLVRRLLVAAPSTRQARTKQKQKKMARIAFSQFSYARYEGAQRARPALSLL